MNTPSLRVRLVIVIGVAGLWFVTALLSTTARSERVDARSAQLTFSSPIFSLAKTVSQPAPKPNELITYTLDYSNAEAGTQASNVRLYDFLPAGVQFVAAAPPPASFAGNVLIFTTPTLTSTASSVTVRVTVRVLEGYEQLVNHALVEADNAAPTYASLLTSVQQPPTWLELTKSSLGAALINGELVYTLICKNTSGITVNDVTVVDVLPAGLTFVAASPTPNVQTPPLRSWSLGNLGPGEKRTIVITTTAPATAGAIVNTALADARQRVVTQTLLTTPVVTQAAILDAAKDGPVAVDLGDTLVYTIRYRNVGNLATTGVVLTDTFPANINIIAVNPPATSLTNQRGVWLIGTVGAASAESEIVITATVQGSARRTLTNRVDIAGQVGYSDHAEWETQVRPIFLYMPVVRRNN